MTPISLLFSTGYPQTDDSIRGIIGIFETAFPGRIRSYYLVGSYVDRSATAVSDIDIRIIFKGDFEADEETRIRTVRHYCDLLSPIEIDCPPLSEGRILNDVNWQHEPLGIKTGGELLYGEEIRHTFPELNFEAYVQNVTAVPLHRMARIRNQQNLEQPLAYPDPDDEFFGYLDDTDVDGETIASTKTLVHLVGFAATCLLAFEAGKVVTRKSDWLRFYKETINDRWTPYLVDIYLQCKETWAYQVPEDEGEREQLREICRQTLAFENDYLERYQAYLENRS